jgi:hypothetical protein
MTLSCQPVEQRSGVALVIASLLASVLPALAHAQPAEKSRANVDPLHKTVDGPARPIVSEVEELDYAALPLMAPVPNAPISEQSFEILEDFGNPNATPSAPSWNLKFAKGADAVFSLSDLTVLNRTHLTSGPPRPGHAQWYVMTRPRTKAGALSIRRYEGEFDGKVATAKTALGVEPQAIIPGEIYAYRRCTARCESSLDDPAREEVIGLIASPAIWWESSDGLLRDAWRRFSSFTTVTASVRPGSSAMVGVVIAPDAAGGIVPGTRLPKLGPLSLELDVLWEEGSTPALTVSIGSFDGVSGIAPK